jgi:hypothetical protein
MIRPQVEFPLYNVFYMQDYPMDHYSEARQLFAKFALHRNCELKTYKSASILLIRVHL